MVIKLYFLLLLFFLLTIFNNIVIITLIINMEDKHMDTTDLNILEALKYNGRSTASEISKKVHLSIPAVSERIKKLDEANIIEQYTIKINRDKLEYKLLAMIFLNIDQTTNIQHFREIIIRYSEKSWSAIILPVNMITC